MAQLPAPLRAVLGLAVSAFDEARQLPQRAMEFPVVAVSSALQMSLRAQQQYAELTVKGDELLGRLHAGSDEPPAWATIDDDPPPSARTSKFDAVERDAATAATDPDLEDALVSDTVIAEALIDEVLIDEVLIDEAGDPAVLGVETSEDDLLLAELDTAETVLGDEPSFTTSSEQPPATKLPAKKTPAGKTPARKAPAKKAPAKKTAAKKAPATKALSRKAPGRKAVGATAPGHVDEPATIASPVTPDPAALSPEPAGVDVPRVDDPAVRLPGSAARRPTADRPQPSQTPAEQAALADDSPPVGG